MYGSKPSPDYHLASDTTYVMDRIRKRKSYWLTKINGPKTLLTLAPIFNNKLIPTKIHVLGSSKHSMICSHLNAYVPSAWSEGDEIVC